MSMLDLKKMPVKSRIVGSFIYSFVTTLLMYLCSFVLEDFKFNWGFYVFYFVGTLVLGFFLMPYTIPKKKKK